MKESLYRIKALAQKELKDFAKNKNISIACMLPLIIVFIFGLLSRNDENFPMSGMDLLSLGLSMNLVFVSTFAMSMLIAEEKEKNTLRTLMLSSVKPYEFLLGKAIVIFVFGLLTNIAMYFFTGMDASYLHYYVMMTSVLSMIMMLVGASIGMMAKDQMSTSIIGMPVVLLFLLLPVVAAANKTIESITDLLPNQIIMSSIEETIQLGSFQFTFLNNVLMVIWFGVSLGLFTYAYK